MAAKGVGAVQKRLIEEKNQGISRGGEFYERVGQVKNQVKNAIRSVVPKRGTPKVDTALEERARAGDARLKYEKFKRDLGTGKAKRATR